MQKILSSHYLLPAFITLFSLLVLYNLFLLTRFIFLKWKPHLTYTWYFGGWQVKFYKIIEPALFLLVALPAVASLIATPKVAFPTDPAMGTVEVTNLKPVEVKFDHLLKKTSIKAEITPELAGQWQAENDIWHSQGRMIFTPSESPLLNTRYTVSITGIENIWGSEQTKYLFSFQTLPLPEIESVSISEGDEGVLADQEIEIKMAQFPEKSARIDFELSPPLNLEVKASSGTYLVKAKTGFQKGSSYNLKVFRTLLSYNYINGETKDVSEKVEIKSFNFKIVEAPGVKATYPSGSGVMVDTSISIEFKQDMDTQSVERSFSILPNVAGKFSWEGQRKIIFKPDSALSKNTKYQILITTDALTGSNETLSEAVSFNFTTIGYVSVSKFFPANGASGVALDASISVTFNQDVDHASAESKFSINPAITGNFSWSGNTMSFRHGAFLSSTKYTVTVATGVKSINGLDSNNAFSSTFTTKIPATTINVPSYKQAHMYSCMAVAARNALAFKGVSVSESSVLSRIGYDTTAWSGTWAEGGAVWGDPDAGIVGDIDGKANNIGWGYGSHWTPVANAINSFGRTAEIKTGWDVNGIAAEIAAGNPVIVWWVNGVWPAYVVNWQTPGGKSVRAVNSMHVQVVKGFTGTTDNPLSFTVTDSGYGYPSQTFDTATFKAKWSWFSNTAVVVR